MAAVRLDFVRPSDPDLTQLRIYESPTRDGAYTMIEAVNDIGSYPNYISYYTTSAATDRSYWFQIEWWDSKGAMSARSQPVQGGTQTVVSRLVDRMKLYDHDIDEGVATHEAETVISEVKNVTDPYEVSHSDVTHSEYSGMTLLALARIYLIKILTQAKENADYTAGLVSQRASKASHSLTDVEKLIAIANSTLGLSFSVIMLLEDLPIAGGLAELRGIDRSRLIYELE